MYPRQQVGSLKKVTINNQCTPNIICIYYFQCGLRTKVHALPIVLAYGLAIAGMVWIAPMATRKHGLPGSRIKRQLLMSHTNGVWRTCSICTTISLCPHQLHNYHFIQKKSCQASLKWYFSRRSLTVSS